MLDTLHCQSIHDLAILYVFSDQGAALSWRLVNGALLSIYPAAQGAYSLQLSTAKPCCSHRGQPLPAHSVANKDTGIHPCHLTPTTSPARRGLQERQSLRSRVSPVNQTVPGPAPQDRVFLSGPRGPLLESPHQPSGQLRVPTLGYHRPRLVAQEEPQPFKGLGLLLLAMNVLHSLLSSTVSLDTALHSTASRHYKNKTAFSRLPTTPLPPSSAVKTPGPEAQEIHLPCCSGGGEGDDAPACWAWRVAGTLCQGRSRFTTVHGKPPPPPPAASRATAAPAPTPFSSRAAPPFCLQ